MNTEERLARLEQAVAELLGTRKQTKATRFVVSQPQGLPEATFESCSDGPDLTLTCKGSVASRVQIVASEDGPMILMFDDSNQPRLVVSMLGNGPRITLSDSSGKIRAALAVQDDVPVIALFDSEGAPIWSAP